MNKHLSDYIMQGAIPFCILHIFYLSKNIQFPTLNTFYAQLLKQDSSLLMRKGLEKITKFKSQIITVVYMWGTILGGSSPCCKICWNWKEIWKKNIYIWLGSWTWWKQSSKYITHDIKNWKDKKFLLQNLLKLRGNMKKKYIWLCSWTWWKQSSKYITHHIKNWKDKICQT
jgi:hypothetical protein